MVVTPWPRNPIIYEINAWVWLHELSQRYERSITLVIVPSEEWVCWKQSRRRFSGLVGRAWRLTDIFSGDVYDRTGDEMSDPGLYVGLEAWGFHFLRVEEE